MELVLATGVETALIISAAMAAVAGATSAGLSIAQADAANEQAKTAAKAEEEAAKSRTDIRLQEVRKLRSAQRAIEGAEGLSQTSGSIAAIERETDSQLRAAEYADRYQTSARVSSIRAAGQNARTAGYIGAGVTLLDSGAQAFDYYSRAKRTPAGGAQR